MGIGQPEDPPASSDIASTSLLAHVKRLSAKFGAKGRQTANESISVVQASDAPPTVVRSGASASTSSLALQVGSAATFDTADFAGICFDFAGFATSQVLTVEACNTENGTFRAVQVRNLATGALTTTINAVGLYQLLTVARYVRLRVSTAGSNGVTSGTAFCKALAAA